MRIFNNGTKLQKALVCHVHLWRSPMATLRSWLKIHGFFMFCYLVTCFILMLLDLKKDPVIFTPKIGKPFKTRSFWVFWAWSSRGASGSFRRNSSGVPIDFQCSKIVKMISLAPEVCRRGTYWHMPPLFLIFAKGRVTPLWRESSLPKKPTKT